MKIRVRDSVMDVYLGAPERQAPGSAIVLMYHRGGNDDFSAFAKAVVDNHWLLALVGEGGHSSATISKGGWPPKDRLALAFGGAVLLLGPVQAWAAKNGGKSDA